MSEKSHSKKEKDYETYAVTLYFDEKSTAKIKNAIKELSGISGNFFMTENEVPPHLTLGMFHCKKEDLERLEEVFKVFSDKIEKAFPVYFSGVDTFKEKVLFLRLKAEAYKHLLLLNEILHSTFLPYFEAGGNKNYLPENWLPHVALLEKLNKEQFELGLNAIKHATADFSKTEKGKFEQFERCAPTIQASLSHTKISLPTSAKITEIGLARCNPYKEITRIPLKTDALSSLQRHKNMAAIKSTGNSLETSLRSQLFKFGFRFRKNDKRLSGSPDIVFPHYHAAIFINGCFWHAHGWNQNDSQNTTQNQSANSTFSDFDISYNTKPCEKFHFPKSNKDFWYTKFKRNNERDLRDINLLLDGGWRVLVVWECSITGKNKRQKIYDIASRISYWLEEEYTERFVEF